MIRLRGEDTEATYRDWATSQVRNAHDLSTSAMRFASSTSLASLAATIAIAKATNTLFSVWMTAGVIGFIISAGVGFFASLPARQLIDGETDLYCLHSKFIRRSRMRLCAWAILWMISVGLCLYGLFAPGETIRG